MWQSMKTAPRDGTEIQAEIPGNGSDNVIAFRGAFVDSDGNSCVCWERNADNVASVKPTRWKHLPANQIEE